MTLEAPPLAPGRALGSAEQAPVERVAHELGAARAPQLVLQTCAMRLDGAHREMQLFGDLRVGVAEGKQPSTWNSRSVRSSGGGPGSGCGAASVWVAARRTASTSSSPGRSSRMQAAAPAWSAWRTNRGSSFAMSTMTRVAGRPASPHGWCRATRCPRPVEVEDERGGRVAHHRLDGRPGVAGLRYDLESGRALEQAAQLGANGRVVGRQHQDDWTVALARQGPSLRPEGWVRASRELLSRSG